METMTRYRITGWKIHITAGIVCGLLLHPTVPKAATMYKWVDEDGNVTYQDSPPPRDSKILSESELETLDLTTSAVNDAASTQNPVTLYTTPNCEICDLVRMNLTELQIPFIERRLNTDRAAQRELQERTGQLVAPTLFMGESRIETFSQEHLRESAIDAGYAIPESPVGAEESPDSDITQGQPAVDQ